MERDREFTDYVVARRNQLRQIAFVVVGDWHLAEDVVQKALMKLYVAWPRACRADSPDAYVRRIIINCSIDESGGRGVGRPARRSLSRYRPVNQSLPSSLSCSRRSQRCRRASVGLSLYASWRISPSIRRPTSSIARSAMSRAKPHML